MGDSIIARERDASSLMRALGFLHCTLLLIYIYNNISSDPPPPSHYEMIFANYQHHQSLYTTHSSSQLWVLCILSVVMSVFVVFLHLCVCLWDFWWGYVFSVVSMIAERGDNTVAEEHIKCYIMKLWKLKPVTTTMPMCFSKLENVCLWN